MHYEKSYIDEQKKRSQIIKNMTTEYTLPKFSAEGKWQGEVFSLGLREKLMYCVAFLGSRQKEAVQMANTIIKQLKYHFCHFSPMISLELLIKYADLLEDEAREGLENYSEGVLDEYMGSDLDFVGVNDNFPSMATFVSLIGGEMFNKQALYLRGKERLGQLASLLTRRGVASEYNSPTYSAVQMLAIAEIANIAPDEEIRKLALQCEERLWADLIGHFHYETSQVAGPYSRAYTVDSTGHTHQSRYLLYAILGDKLAVNLLNTVFLTEQAQKGAVIHHSVPFHQISAAWILDTEYHCPEYLIELAMNKKYPFEFIADTEFSSSTDAITSEPARDPWQQEDYTFEYPAGNGKISTYMTEDYAIGGATRDFHNGVQTDAFHVLYRRRAPVVSQDDINTVYCRYIINEKQPGTTIFSFEDEGRKTCLQEKNTAMVLYKPKISCRSDVSSLKLLVMIPVYHGMVDEIWLGDVRLDLQKGREKDKSSSEKASSKILGESMEPCSVYIKDGPVYMVFHPLLLTNYGRKSAARVEDNGDYILISFYNYEGAARDFAARGFLLTGNGFAAEIRSKQEMASFEAFRKQFGKYEIKDMLQFSVHSRQTYIRKTSYTREGLILECEYSPVSEGIKCMTANGKAPEQPKLKITGFNVSRLPLME